MGKFYIYSFVTVCIATLMIVPTSIHSTTYNLLPYQDTNSGRNSNAYLSTAETISNQQKELFVKEITEYAIKANEKWGIPASAIIGMAILESGFGTTQIATDAKNIFGIKVWGYNPPTAYQLLGQPDEDFEKTIPVLADYGEDRKVFDETQRRDNWYRKFSSYEDAVNYLSGKLFLNERYGFARELYTTRMGNGWTHKNASKQFLFDIADAGYNHKGGEYYSRTVGKIMDNWNLYQYDQMQLTDIKGHWAEDSIRHISNLKIIEGFPDGTFLPNYQITREQFVKILVLAMDYPITNEEEETFKDIRKTNWSYPYIETALRNEIIIESEYKEHFEPYLFITREEMAVMVARALKLPPADNLIEFTDSNEINEHVELVRAAVNNGIILGFKDGTFKPKDFLTRAQAAIVIERVLNFR